jgi:ribosomal protein L3
MMRDYIVKWEIELTASSPEEAAELAFEIQRDVFSTATVFDVSGVTVELDPLTGIPV